MQQTDGVHPSHPPARSGSERLSILAGRLEPPVTVAEDVVIRSITSDSRQAEAGSLFVAIPGTQVDGHDFIADAVSRGAAAVVVERESPGVKVPVVRVPSARAAFAQLAAAWHGDPARRLTLFGITGTVGKTSALAVLEAILLRDGQRVGTIGSLGLRIDGETLETSSYTAPDPMMLHGEFARIVDAGVGLGAMEVTSHALTQERVHGLRYAAGMFTNLVPLEHGEYHGNFRDYVEAKSRFFDYLLPAAPVVYNADDRAVRRLVRARDVRGVGVGLAPHADLRIAEPTVGPDGTHLTLQLRSPLPRPQRSPLAPLELPLQLRLLGRANVVNAALAGAAAMVLGASPDAVSDALATLTPPRRRMQIIHRGRFTVLDDTVGHPDSISVVFELVDALAPRRVHVVFAVRGQRGPRINRYNGDALAIWAARVPLQTLIITRSADATDARNDVSDREVAAFTRALERRAVEFELVDDLAEAVPCALQSAGPGDLVLLLGAQGMDAGAELARQWLASP